MWITFVAAVFELLGVFLLGKKNKLGFVSAALGGVTWIIYVFVSKSDAYGLLLVCSVAFFLNIKGFLNWKKSVCDE